MFTEMAEKGDTILYYNVAEVDKRFSTLMGDVCFVFICLHMITKVLQFKLFVIFKSIL